MGGVVKKQLFKKKIPCKKGKGSERKEEREGKRERESKKNEKMKNR